MAINKTPFRLSPLCRTLVLIWQPISCLLQVYFTKKKVCWKLYLFVTANRMEMLHSRFYYEFTGRWYHVRPLSSRPL